MVEEVVVGLGGIGTRKRMEGGGVYVQDRGVKISRLLGTSVPTRPTSGMLMSWDEGWRRPVRNISLVAFVVNTDCERKFFIFHLITRLSLLTLCLQR